MATRRLLRLHRGGVPLPPSAPPSAPPVAPPPTVSTTVFVTTPLPGAAVWGPRVWSLFHTLAEYSDRCDVLQIWFNWLQATVQVMPCVKCRMHLGSYLRMNTVMKPRDIHTTSPMEFKDIIKRDLLKLHNDVNRRTGKPAFTVEQLAPMYGTKSRAEAVRDATQRVEELVRSWEPHLHVSISPRALAIWRSTASILIALIGSGASADCSSTSMVTSRRRR